MCINTCIILHHLTTLSKVSLSPAGMTHLLSRILCDFAVTRAWHHRPNCHHRSATALSYLVLLPCFPPRSDAFLRREWRALHFALAQLRQELDDMKSELAQLRVAKARTRNAGRARDAGRGRRTGKNDRGRFQERKKRGHASADPRILCASQGHQCR